MFGPRRGFPIPGIFLFVAGFAVAAMLGGAAASAAWLLVLPLFLFKMMFFFFVIGVFFRFAVGGFGWGRGRGQWGRAPWAPGPWGGSDRGRPAPPREPSQEERDWQEARRAAKEEIDGLFPDEPQ